MNRVEMLGALTKVFAEVFDIPTIVLSDATSAADIDEWDSLTHVQLVVAIERRFQIRFSAAEIRGWTSVGSLCDCIEQRQAKRTT